MAIVESTQAHFNTIGTLGADRALSLLSGLIGTAALLFPGVVGIHRAKEIDTGTGQTILPAAVLNQAVIGGALAEDRHCAAWITLTDVFLQQIECFRRKCRKYIGCMASEVMSHTAAHGEAGGINAFYINIRHFLNIFNNGFGKGHVIYGAVAGTAGADIPGRACAACSSGGRYKDKAFLVSDTAVTGVDFLPAVTTQAVEANDQRYVAVCRVAVWYM